MSNTRPVRKFLSDATNINNWMVCGQWSFETYDKSLFNRIQEQEGGMSVELGDDATYLLRGVGSISF
jgi:hypothetical protein